MIRIPDTPLDPTAASALAGFQADLDALPNYADRVNEAEKKFASRNSKRNKTFRVVRGTLTAMCSGAKRCMYCEDSVADEIEHVWPKQLYPGRTFVWENYVYACGPCNGGKRSKFVVFGTSGKRHDVTRKPGAAVVPPVSGQPFLIDPRTEDPMDFLHLDLRGTFFFIPKSGLRRRGRKRAIFTLDLLKLNSKDSLVTARREAYHALLDRLHAYAAIQTKTPKSPKLMRTERSIREIGQRTVWEEMKRQRGKINELRELFKAVPEAVNW